MEYYSVIKKNEMMPCTTAWMDLDGVVLSEVSQAEKEKYCMTSLICEIEKDTNELTEQKETHRLTKWTYSCQGEGIVREFGKVMYTLLYSKWITNKDLLYSAWNSTQCYVPAWMRTEFGGEWMHIYVRLSPFAVCLNYYNIVNRLYSNTK